ncbi:MAG: carbonic anhydrase [Alphaproteobacteria bacterium]|nr:MAG: carbonic anhydrase [Alphaproteobacteria bacterium]
MADDILKKLVKGFEAFRKEHYETNPDKMKDVVENGQRPKALVFSCADSRNSPEMLMGTEPGDIFVGRQIAALVPPYDKDDKDDTIAASVEFAVNTLKVEHIIVMGHTSCGGIQGLVNDLSEGSVGHWVQRAREMKDKVKAKLGDKANDHDTLLAEVEKESILWSLENLRKYPAVDAALKEGRLQIHAWQFDMKKGEMNAYNPQTHQFEPVATDVAVEEHDHKHGENCVPFPKKQNKKRGFHR